jgi:hypothetical protein
VSAAATSAGGLEILDAALILAGVVVTVIGVKVDLV